VGLNRLKDEETYLKKLTEEEVEIMAALGINSSKEKENPRYM
jgi:hypothetical protein